MCLTTSPSQPDDGARGPYLWWRESRPRISKNWTPNHHSWAVFMAGRPPLRIGQHGKITRTQISKDIWVARCRYRDRDGVTRRLERMSPHGEPDEYGAKAESA